ncbi:suppressor of glycerol defect [Exophiala sideris]|uniref:Suppressor of glycerol defect n=1 Tax=Exophiala sideris TaxID=1016849 RepID=A0ABR0JSP4_9EURO|nr:suppressor of glycerol defect [Exophiala sideris]KAK5068981.1 suppressor of glycerol defect [Exophiala sideris]KAK5186578.1 suppressor of glycerol defect [Eurotiomycetes sp. CCFEE 6388]
MSDALRYRLSPPKSTRPRNIFWLDKLRQETAEFFFVKHTSIRAGSRMHMSRLNGRPLDGIKLPFALQKELGLDEKKPNGRQRPGAVQKRKEQRKAGRLEKKHNIRGSRPHTRPFADNEESEEEHDEDVYHKRIPLPVPTKKKTTQASTRNAETRPKSILKKPRQPSPSLSEPSSHSESRSESPGLVLDASSKAFRERAEQDDAEISVLEKRLGLKKKALPKSFEVDGLDDLLGGLDEDSADRGVKRKSEGEQWLERKRRKALAQQEESEEEDTDVNIDGLDAGDSLDGTDDSDNLDNLHEGGLSEDGFDLGSDLDEDDFSDEQTENSNEDGFDGFGSGKEEESVPPKKIRENPYVAPVTSNTPTAKYVPPSLRKAQNSEGASLERLKRQIQGHLNKLSKANLVSILGEIEKVYQSNPRQDVTSVLIELLLTLFYNKATLPNTFVILHAAFAAAVYKVIGVDFGAELLSQLVDRFDQYHSDSATGKESLNMISLLSNLFTFNVVSSAIIFDHIRLLLVRLSENNTELLLRMIRDCGPQLRQDDPSSMKAIVQLMQKEAARMNSAGDQMSVRTKFMIETITDLKNNKMKAATNNAGLSSEHITQMRKVLGSLNNRALRASDPLRITRNDIQNSDKKGKWWLVGASWKGNDNTPAIEEAVTRVTDNDLLLDDAESVDLLALARRYGMNTDVRRSIFIALLSAVDYQDAHMRLFKLRLKRNQEQEIPKVLLRCAAGEKPYNHYYTLVAKRLCLDKRMRKGFQFALWSFFRRTGETPDMDEAEDNDEDQNIDMSEIANMARLYAHLILDGAETLGVLKVLDLAYIKERTTMFVELLLIMIMTEANSAKQGSLERLFERTAETSQIIKRLQYFIKKNVRKSDLVSKADKATVQRGCKIALDTLARLDAMGGGVAE